MSKFAFIAAVLLAAPSPVLAQIVFDDSPPPPAAPAKSAKVKSDVDKVECRSQDTLGSRLEAHQVCMTKSQWSAYEQEYKQKVHDMQVLGLQSH
jgi:hypothetical protein